MTSEHRLEEQIEQYAVLSEPAGGELQDLVELVAQVCDVPRAAINIVAPDEQHMIATAGLDPLVCARDDSMCAQVMTERRPVVVPDASADPRFVDNPFVTGIIGDVRFYASAPLITPDDTTIGRLCVFDDVPREMSPQQEQALVTLSRQVMDVLVLRYRTLELQRSLDELQVVRDELRRSNHHLTHFAGQISHDLRSPLTAILANAELLATEPAVETDLQLHAMVDAVSQAGQRMNRMIEEMLDFALEGGQLRLKETPIERVVELVLADIRPLLRQSHADISIGELPTVVADADMLYSVVLNLLTNALKFGRPGVAPIVDVSATRTTDGWRFIVSDNGTGIAPDRRDAVFNLYARGSADVGGHGIGLATTRRLVEAHGGRVGVEESTSGGAAVWFELPTSTDHPLS